MTAFAVRFVAGGLLVALVPVVAARYGGGLGGILLLAPVVTVAGMAFLSSGERGVLGATALGALKALPAVAAFLVVVWWVSRLAVPGWVAIGAGVAAWAVVAGAVVVL